ncbi:hypothetical protein LJR039_004312 [Pseudorhodoferax sp. LjRoot39]|uniref:hypothetical protein n=1 Tax=Pseudorhodoferax sp. LjRoot39 TaxID=3342328 RepID=UPI003ECF7A23
MASDPFHRNFDGMCWPVPGMALNELEWRQRYAGEPSTSDRMVVASVLSAYSELVRLPQRQRNKIIAELRKGPATSAKSHPQEGRMP